MFWRSTPKKIQILYEGFLQALGLGGDPEEEPENVVYRGGKAYRRVDPQKAAWLYQ